MFVIIVSMFNKPIKQSAKNGSLSAKLLLGRVVENNKIYAHFRAGQVIKGLLCPAGLGKVGGQGPTGPNNRKRQ